MNNKLLHCESVQDFSEKPTSHEAKFKCHSDYKLSFEKSLFCGKSKQIADFQLQMSKSQNLNQEYFQFGTERGECLGFGKLDDFSENKPHNNKAQKASNAFSEQQGFSETQAQQSKTISNLKSKLHQLETSYFLVQSQYTQTILNLKQQLNAKNQQTDALNELLDLLSNEQKSIDCEVEFWMKKIGQVSQKHKNKVVQRHEKEYQQIDDTAGVKSKERKSRVVKSRGIFSSAKNMANSKVKNAEKVQVLVRVKKR